MAGFYDVRLRGLRGATLCYLSRWTMSTGPEGVGPLTLQPTRLNDTTRPKTDVTTIFFIERRSYGNGLVRSARGRHRTGIIYTIQLEKELENG